MTREQLIEQFERDFANMYRSYHYDDQLHHIVANMCYNNDDDECICDCDEYEYNDVNLYSYDETTRSWSFA